MESVNYGLNELHAVQLDMLKKLIAVCKEHDLTYFLAFGSLLGAARNRGVIEWDDSIDVVMPYGDYEKLMGLSQEVWGEDLFLQTYETDPEYPNCYAKLRNSRTTMIKADYADLDINHGVFINIMPLVRLADDARARRRQFRSMKLYKALTAKEPLPVEDGVLCIWSSMLLGAPEEKRIRMRDKQKARVLKYEGKDTGECVALSGSASLTLPLKCEWFSSAVEGEFENMKVDLPTGWHEWLTLRYGDYTVAPISELQGDKIARIVTLNTDKPYTEYKGITYCVK